MLTLWTLIFVSLSFEILTINSIILHEHKVMKERNFGKLSGILIICIVCNYFSSFFKAFRVYSECESYYVRNHSNWIIVE